MGCCHFLYGWCAAGTSGRPIGPKVSRLIYIYIYIYTLLVAMNFGWKAQSFGWKMSIQPLVSRDVYTYKYKYISINMIFHSYKFVDANKNRTEWLLLFWKKVHDCYVDPQRRKFRHILFVHDVNCSGYIPGLTLFSCLYYFRWLYLLTFLPTKCR